MSEKLFYSKGIVGDPPPAVRKTMSELVKCSCGFSVYSQKTIEANKNLFCPGCKKPMSEYKCGCGYHKISSDEKNIVYFKNEWWRLRCLFVKIDKRMPKIISKFEKMERELAKSRKMRLKFIRMKNFIKKTPCSHCGHPAGNRFAQVGDQVLCGQCKGAKK